MKKSSNEQLNELNKKVNLLYRQLGKVVYNCNKENFQEVDEDVLRIKNKITNIINKIKQIEKTKDKKNIEGHQDKRVLKPEVNEEGIPVYRFCPHCKVGNHPDSTHCIKCDKPLY